MQCLPTGTMSWIISADFYFWVLGELDKWWARKKAKRTFLNDYANRKSSWRNSVTPFYYAHQNALELHQRQNHHFLNYKTTPLISKLSKQRNLQELGKVKNQKSFEHLKISKMKTVGLLALGGAMGLKFEDLSYNNLRDAFSKVR